jgi:hypothetical protein
MQPRLLCAASSSVWSIQLRGGRVFVLSRGKSLGTEISGPEPGNESVVWACRVNGARHNASNKSVSEAAVRLLRDVQQSGAEANDDRPPSKRPNASPLPFASLSAGGEGVRVRWIPLSPFLCGEGRGEGEGDSRQPARSEFSATGKFSREKIARNFLTATNNFSKFALMPSR